MQIGNAKHNCGVFASEGFYWFRLCGYGLQIKCYHRHSVLAYTEIKNTTRIGRWGVKVLKP